MFFKHNNSKFNNNKNYLKFLTLKILIQKKIKIINKNKKKFVKMTKIQKIQKIKLLHQEFQIHFIAKYIK